MDLSRAIMLELEKLNDEQRQKVLDFARSLREKEEEELDAMMDLIIEENIYAFKELAK